MSTTMNHEMLHINVSGKRIHKSVAPEIWEDEINDVHESFNNISALGA